VRRRARPRAPRSRRPRSPRRCALHARSRRSFRDPMSSVIDIGVLTSPTRVNATTVENAATARHMGGPRDPTFDQNGAARISSPRFVTISTGGAGMLRRTFTLSSRVTFALCLALASSSASVACGDDGAEEGSAGSSTADDGVSGSRATGGTGSGGKAVSAGSRRPRVVASAALQEMARKRAPAAAPRSSPAVRARRTVRKET
jgi:hypothetical protein